ncbi:MAG: apolipoprotein A1/A4/E family protein [Chitinophagaceae bacterium]|nr:apolipoprotein A1/A4/E family protein [Chitinophagaceae bacterium]
MLRGLLLVYLLMLTSYGLLHAQDTTISPINLPEKYLSSVDKKMQSLDDQLSQQSAAYLNKLSKQEEKIRKKLAKLDSSKAAEIFGEAKKSYEQLSQKLNAIDGKTKSMLSGEYLPYLDSLQGTLGFLKDAKNVIAKTSDIQQKLSKSLEQVNQLQNKLQKAEEIKAYVSQRQEQLKNLLAQYTDLPRSVSKYFGKYQQQAYYYGQQLKEYKEALNDPDKLLSRVLSTLQTIPAFKKFMSKYSMLAMLFTTPDNYDPTQIVQGLPSRQQVMSLIQNQTGNTNTNSLAMVQQNVGAAQSQVDEIRNRMNELGSNSKDLTMPDFKPNDMRTKSFLKKLEYGTSFQSQRATNYFPAASNIGVTLGYKISKKSVIGIGISGKVGWGTGWKHIRVSSQGVGLRFYADWKVPAIWGSKEGNLWITGGAEMNYQRSVESLEVFKNYTTWTKSALVGLSKKFKAGKKLNGKISVLFDFLYREHIPVSEPFIFRMGYTLN